MLKVRSRLLIGAGIGMAMALLIAAPARASVAVPPTIYDFKGWRITVLPEFQVQVNEDPAPANELSIQLFKTFDGVVEADGTMPAIILTFQQILPDAQCASQIIINDETVINHTGMDWSGLNFVLAGPTGYATYNQAATFPGDFGGDPQQNFSTTPFDQHYWTGSSGSEALHLTDGLLPANSFFTPGASSGSLKIDVDLASAGSLFVFKEVPVAAPEPMTLCLLGLGGAVMAIRRRRR